MTTSELTEHHALTAKRRSQKLPIRAEVDKAAWIEANDLPMGILVGCIEPSSFLLIQDCELLPDAMVALAKRHQPTEDIDKIELTKEYHAITGTAKNERVEAFIDRYEALVRRMRQAKLPGADDDYMVTSKLGSLLPYE